MIGYGDTPSAFVVKGTPISKDAGVPVGNLKSVFSDLKDILPALRDEGELKLKGRDFTGFTEWIPGVDPVGELIEDTWLPPLPPAVTTLMRQYEDVEGDEPGGGGHLNIMIDLSGSMSAPIGKNSEGQEMDIKGACMTLAVVLINGCKKGGHTFTIGGFGDRDGRRADLVPLIAPDKRDAAFWKNVDTSTRIIWGSNAAQRKDYQGAILSIDTQVSLGKKYTGGWSSMGLTNSGAGVARMYQYMDETMKGTEIRTAPLIFLSDMRATDVDVPSSAVSNAASGHPTINPDVLDMLAVDASGRPNQVGNQGFWYWAKKYHDKYGPVIVIQLVKGKGPTDEILDKNYLARMREAFPQYLGRGRTRSEYLSAPPQSGQPAKGCFMSESVQMTPQGGNLRQVAVLLTKFLKNMNGEGEICCGGKGMNF